MRRRVWPGVLGSGEFGKTLQWRCSAPEKIAMHTWSGHAASECDAASDAVTGGASTLGALAPPVLLGSLEGIRRHFAKRPAKRPRKLAPQACPPTPPATEEEQERAREGTARLVAALAAEGLI